MLHRGVVLAAMVAPMVFAAGCGAAGTGGPSVSAGVRNGTLHVVATEAPTCPVQKVGGPPCVAPYVGKLDIFDSSGRQVDEVVTTAAGTADVSLPPGTYSVKAPMTPSGLPRLTLPVTLTVTASATVTAQLDFDTGIR